LILARIAATCYERIRGNLLLCWERHPGRTLLTSRFRFQVPEIEFVAIHTGRFVPIDLTVDVFFHRIGGVENVNARSLLYAIQTLMAPQHPPETLNALSH